MNCRSFIFLSTSLFLFAACAPAPKADPTQVPTIDPTQTTTPEVRPTQTPMPSSTPAKLPSATPTVKVTPPPTNTFEGQIAYIGKKGEIRVLRSDTGEQISITSESDDQYQYIAPQFSPDGRQIAYCQQKMMPNPIGGPPIPEKERILFIKNIENGSTRKLADDVYCLFSWSPDGGNIIYGKQWGEFSGGSWEHASGIWQVDIATGEEKEIIPALRNNPFRNPQWSPDGKWIKYYEVLYIEGVGRFWIWNLNQSKEISWGNIVVGYTNWAPNGGLIVFDEVTYIPLEAVPGSSIFASTPEGSKIRKIYSESDYVAFHPMWSPNGLMILATLYKPFTFPESHILMNDDGKIEKMIKPDKDIAPIDWSPNGQQILFIEYVDHVEDVHNLLIYDILGDFFKTIERGVKGESVSGDWAPLPD